MPTPTVFDIYVKKFSPNLYTLAQQRESKFASKVRRESAGNAEEAYYDTVGPDDDPTQDTTHKGDTPDSEGNYGRRKVKPDKWHKGRVLDDKDLARTLADLNGSTTQSFAASFGRKKDKIIIDAMLGTAYIGKDGTGTKTFIDESVSINAVTGGTVSTLGTGASVTSATAIELAKMFRMMQIFNDENVDENIKKYWAMRPSDMKALLAITAIGSIDYNEVKAGYEGKVSYYGGFNIFWSTLVPISDATINGDVTCYRNLVWAEDGVILSYIGDLSTQMAPDTTKCFNTRIYSKMDLGAVRMEGAKVHECLNLIG
jgi:hypothetical protein